MQILRNISQSRAAAILTGLFAALMVVLSFEKNLTTIQQQVHSQTDLKTHKKLLTLLHAHQQQLQREPTTAEIETYKNQAESIVKLQEQLKSYFTKNKLYISTKQLLSVINNNQQLEHLVKSLDSVDSNNRNDISEQLDEIKNIVLHNTLQESLRNSAIITEPTIERVREAFMQQRSYQWLEIDNTYLVQEEKDRVSNEAEIQQYYQTHDFPSIPSATINYIEIKKDSIKKPHLNDKKFRELLSSSDTLLPVTQSYETITYDLSDQPTGNKLNIQDVFSSLNPSSPVPEKTYSNTALYYTKSAQQTLSDKTFSLRKIPALRPNEYAFYQTGNQWKLILAKKVSSQKCSTQQCLSKAKESWKNHQQEAEMNEKVAHLQQTKLFTPKNIHQVAEKMNLPVKKSDIITPNSKNPHLSSNILINQIFDDSTNKASKNISDTIELDNGNVIVYQIGSFTPTEKEPLEKVRDHIINKLRTNHINSQLAKDTALAIKQLHNGEPIDSLAKKFQSSIKQSKKISDIKKLPSQIQLAAQRIPSADIGWMKPALEYHPESKKWYLLALTDIVYTNKSNAAIDTIASDEKVENILKNLETNIVFKDILSS